MIRLNNMHPYPLKRRVFYFRTMDDCNEFLNVFKENSCNVEWAEPIKIPDTAKIKNGERMLMDKPAKERAENALPWGFEITTNPFLKFTV